MVRNSCRGCKSKWPQRVSASWKYHSASWSFPFTATTRSETSFNLSKGSCCLSSTSERSSYKLVFLQPCLLVGWRRYLMTKWRSWMTQAVIGACFFITRVTIKLKKLRYCERRNSHWLRNITGVLKDTMSWRLMIRINLLQVVRVKMMIQAFVVTARQRSCLMSSKQHMST